MNTIIIFSYCSCSTSGFNTTCSGRDRGWEGQSLPRPCQDRLHFQPRNCFSRGKSTSSSSSCLVYFFARLNWKKGLAGNHFVKHPSKQPQPFQMLKTPHTLSSLNFLLYRQKLIKVNTGVVIFWSAMNISACLLCLTDVRGGAASSEPPSHRQGWNAELWSSERSHQHGWFQWKTSVCVQHLAWMTKREHVLSEQRSRNH